jgi:hypothetical protein
MTIPYIIVSLLSGLLFGVMDGLINRSSLAIRLYSVIEGVINHNFLATRLYAVYRPIARTSINVPGGVSINLISGFVMAGIFLLFYRSLPGESGVAKGISFGLIVWFFQIVMYAASRLMFALPIGSVLYMVIAGLGEMLVLGALYGLTLRPAT